MPSATALDALLSLADRCPVFESVAGHAVPTATRQQLQDSGFLQQLPALLKLFALLDPPQAGGSDYCLGKLESGAATAFATASAETETMQATTSMLLKLSGRLQGMFYPNDQHKGQQLKPPGLPQLIAPTTQLAAAALRYLSRAVDPLPPTSAPSEQLTELMISTYCSLRHGSMAFRWAERDSTPNGTAVEAPALQPQD